MTSSELSFETTGLLVSVRNGVEARAALAGGADVIDVKEPGRGSLGAADSDAMSTVVRMVNGRSLVSAAYGELMDLIHSPHGYGTWLLPPGVSLFKIGLAACLTLRDWQTHWQESVAAIVASSIKKEARPVAVAYADWRDAQSPSPRDVLELAVEHRCPALLIDTWNKSSGSLFRHWSIVDLKSFLASVREQNIGVVLAGSLIGDSIAAAAQLCPDLIAVRTAACDNGRQGTVSEHRVRDLKQSIATACLPSARQFDRV